MAKTKEAVALAVLMHGNTWIRYNMNPETLVAGIGKAVYTMVWAHSEWKLSRHENGKRGRGTNLGTYKTAMVAARVAAMNAQSKRAR